jgi:hypothetical protein
MLLREPTNEEIQYTVTHNDEFTSILFREPDVEMLLWLEEAVTIFRYHEHVIVADARNMSTETFIQLERWVRCRS